MRYGRILNKMKIDQADIKFAGQCNILLDKADTLFQQAAAAAEQVDQLGMPQGCAWGGHNMQTPCSALAPVLVVHHTSLLPTLKHVFVNVE